MITGEALQKRRLELWTTYKCGHEWCAPGKPLTCDDCEANETCEFAFDCYNSNGDCLASK